MKSDRILVTGGAGFIGSKLVKYLLNKKNQVTVFDNFSAANNLRGFESDNLEVVRGDLSHASDLTKLENHHDMIFHLAADPEVRLSITSSESIFKNNILSTYNLLEWAKETKSHTIIFTSTSAVYGDSTIIPTTESNPCIPISLYAGSKIACESMISGYSNTYKKRGIVIRLANVVGPHSNHGILFDMINKLRANKNELQVLGDGNQNKSYLYIDDCISGIMKITQSSKLNFQVFNLGSNSQIKVADIVDIILTEVGLTRTKKIFTGGIDGGRGWVGDVKNMLLDNEKVRKLGWKPQLDSTQSIRRTVKEIINLNPLN